jgi:XTP/dITP diphosphohydrolase
MPFKLPSQILIATNNQGKFAEIKDLLSQINIEAISASKFNITEPEETQNSFAGNARIKAEFYGKNSGLVALADDSGLCIDALDGAPGVDSAPFAVDLDGKKNFPFAFEKIKKLLIEKGVDINSKPTAHFICNLCLFDCKTNFIINFEGRVDGYLTFENLGNKGFGYDPIFVKNGMTKTFGEIDAKLKDQISHRAEAFRKMLEFLA